MQRIGRVILVIAIAALVAVNGAALVVWLSGGGQAPREVHSGEAAVGGPFDLEAVDGGRVALSDLAGRVPVLVFGWTRDTAFSEPLLRVMEEALRRLDDDRARIAPLFITLDPERDSAADIRTFLARAGSTARGLTGTPAQIQALIATYRLYHRRVPDPALPGGYSIDHAALYYVMDRSGRFAAAVPYTTDSGELAAAIAKLLR
ncbi:MAG: SCO family protein [Hyphomicrobiales bacterium]|nr:SCO family protein [Hyphomicrobiales bacterium]